MADPRKPVFRPETEQQKSIADTVHRHLLAVTSAGAKAIGGTGASFVMIGMGVWAAELAELDGGAAAKFLHALADISDPANNENQKRRVEEDRRHAVRALFAAIDLEMAEVKGNG